MPTIATSHRQLDSSPTVPFEMIRNSLIAYNRISNPFLLWEPSNPTLNALAVGILTTTLSLQALAIVFDFFLGLKSGRQASISDLHSLLIIRKTSPMAVFNNLLRKDWLTRKYYKGDIPKSTRILRDPEHIKMKIAAKLIFLLAAAPTINVLAVAVVLEKETLLSFQEAGFGGLGLGVNMDRSVAKSYMITESCRQYNVSTQFRDEALPQFSVCNKPTFSRLSAEKKYGYVSVGHIMQSEVFVRVMFYGWLSTATALPEIYVNEKLYQVKHALTNATAAALVDIGLDLMAAECASGNTSTAIEATHSTPPNSHEKEVYTKRMACPTGPTSEEEVRAKQVTITTELMKYLTFVDADSLDLREKSTTEFVPADNIVFLRRRRRILSVSILGILCACLVALRLLSMTFLNNDVAIGVELIIKRRLGLKFCESTLRNRSGISYNNKFQDREKAHYGLSRYGSCKVETFEEGSLG